MSQPIRFPEDFTDGLRDFKLVADPPQAMHEFLCYNYYVANTSKNATYLYPYVFNSIMGRNANVKLSLF